MSARKISQAGKPVQWLTPLDLPIVQPYHKAVVSEVTIFEELELMIYIISISGCNKFTSIC